MRLCPCAPAVSSAPTSLDGLWKARRPTRRISRAALAKRCCALQRLLPRAELGTRLASQRRVTMATCSASVSVASNCHVWRSTVRRPSLRSRLAARKKTATFRSPLSRKPRLDQAVLRRRAATRPARPRPNRASEAGSETTSPRTRKVSAAGSFRWPSSGANGECQM